MPKGYGLNLLPLKVSLLFVIISTSLFAFINSLEFSLGVFFASIVILLLGRRLVFKMISPIFKLFVFFTFLCYYTIT